MKNNKRIAVVITAIAVIFLIGHFLWLYNTVETERTKSMVYEDNITVETANAEQLLTSVLTFEPDATPKTPSTPSPYSTPTIMPQATDSFASITIRTDRKTRTYEIMPDVNEITLKKNIGWFPGSVMPGQEGLCILMGHRDTDFSILRYAEIGDELIIYMNDSEYKYSVSAIEIINSDNELRFEANNGSTLVLVTCYPFRFTGHAPQKFVVFAIGIQ